jgi:hypothetical protein
LRTALSYKPSSNSWPAAPCLKAVKGIESIEKQANISVVPFIKKKLNFTVICFSYPHYVLSHSLFKQYTYLMRMEETT